MTKGLEIYKTLIVSTGHLDPKDLDLIDPEWKELNRDLRNFKVTPEDSVIPTLIERTTSGWRIYIYQDCEGWGDDLQELKEQGLSDSLIKLITLAHEQGCRFLEFHWDGSYIANYSIFDW